MAGSKDHTVLLALVKQAGLADRKGGGYKECGCGMGPALNTAASMDAYVLADRGSWLSFRNRGNLGIVVEYDALRGTVRDYHGDQHSTQGPIGLAAAALLAASVNVILRLARRRAARDRRHRRDDGDQPEHAWRV